MSMHRGWCTRAEVHSPDGKAAGVVIMARGMVKTARAPLAQETDPAGK